MVAPHGFVDRSAGNLAFRRIDLAVILLLALAARIAAAMILPDQSANLGDALMFRKAAESLAATGLVSDQYRMPVYPLLILLTGGGKGQLAADIAISALAACFVYLLAAELFRDRAAALLAGLGSALYPPFVFFAIVGLSETLFLTLVLAAFWGWYTKRFFAAAVCAVLAILTRPIFDLAAIFFVLYFSVAVHRLPLRRTLANVGIYAAVYLVLLTPWWIHNYKSYGSFVRFNLAFGMVLYAGNNPLNTTGGGNIGEDFETKAFDHIADPVAHDRAMRDAAVRYMIENPYRTLELAALKFTRIWRLWPHHDSYSSRSAAIVTFLSFAPVCLFALIYLLGWGWRDALRISPPVLFIGYCTAIHMLLLGTIRFRLPFEPYLVMFAAAGAVNLWRATGLGLRFSPRAG